MTENTKIEWADHTFNPWWGCTEVSPGCDHCYARTWAKRYGLDVWGKGVPRRTFGPKHWAEPLKWNAAAARLGIRQSVFCASMADLGDVDAPEGELPRLFALIKATPWLDWLLLTKRPQELARRLPEDWGEGYPNVWLGTSVESPEYIWRAAALLKVPARVRFLSCEPLLGPVDLLNDCPACEGTGGGYTPENECRSCHGDGRLIGGINWVIVGGESGPGARPMDVAWARSLVAQCQSAGVAVFVKQLGHWPVTSHALSRPDESCPAEWLGRWDRDKLPGRCAHLVRLKSAKGGDMAEWPADLRVREFPLSDGRGSDEVLS